MNDYQYYFEIPSEPILTNSKLMCCVDFYGIQRPLFCVASNNLLKCFSSNQLISHMYLNEAPIYITAVRTPQNITKHSEQEQCLLIAYATSVELYWLDGSQMQLILSYSVEIPDSALPEEQKLLQRHEEGELSLPELQEQLRTLGKTAYLTQAAQKIITSAYLPYSNAMRTTITAAGVLNSTDYQGRSLTGQCLCYTTSNNFLVITDPCFTKTLVKIQVPGLPVSLYMEGVLYLYEDGDTELEIKKDYVASAAVTSNTYRATIYTANGTIYSVKAGRVSQNIILNSKPDVNSFRLGTKIFVAHKNVVQKMSPRGKLLEQFALNIQCDELIYMNVPIGRSFLGFLALERASGSGIYFNEAGLCKPIDFNINDIAGMLYEYYGPNYAVFIATGDGKLFYRYLSRKCDFRVEMGVDGRLSGEKMLFDVESMDLGAAVPAIDKQIDQLKLFYPARAAARNVILYELINYEEKNQCKVVRYIENELVYNCHLEGEMFSYVVVIEVVNGGDDVSQPFAATIELSEYLECYNNGIFIPALPPGGRYVGGRNICVKDYTKGMPSHEIKVYFNSVGGRPDGVCVVYVPEVYI